MSLIEVLTKWLLDKVDEKLFESKELTTQQQIEALYHDLDEIVKLFRSWMPTLQRYADDSYCRDPEDQSYYPSPKIVCKQLKDFTEKPPKSLLALVRQVLVSAQNLDFLMARNGIDGFADRLKENIGDILDAISIIKINICRWELYYMEIPELGKEITNRLNQIKTNLGQIESAKNTLLDLAKQLDEPD